MLGLTHAQNTGWKTLYAAILMVLCAVLIWMGDSSQAYADSTFLLQLGSYGSEDEASHKWDEIKSKNADLVGSLTLHVAEVALPPDNTISYRTQAGPIGSHDQAATICSGLKSRGVDCNVVETALFTAADAAPAAKPVAETSASAANAAAATSAFTLPSFISSSGSADAPAAAPAPAPTPVPAPVQAVAPAVNPEPPAMAAPVAPVASSEAVVSTPPKPVVTSQGYVAGQEPKFLNSGAPATASAAPVLTEPSNAYYSAPAETSPAMAQTSADAESAQPPHGYLYRLIHGAPSNTPATTATNPNAVGQVNVAEAIRVPLSSGSHKNKVVAHLPAVRGMGGTPSVNTSKSFWAQISYFSNEEAARDFYDDFAADYPQFSDGVRVRITKPYLSAGQAGRVSLRVGPFASANAVNTICAAAVARKTNCSLVHDIGASTAQSAQRPAKLDHSYFAPPAPVEEVSTPKYWVQLGSFRSAEQAWDEWEDLKQDQHRLLGKLQATVTTPSISSSTHVQYRLRTGPFMNESGADNLCNALEGIGASNCIVVNDR